MKRGRLPAPAARSVIRNRLQEFLVTRITSTSGSAGQSSDSKSTHYESLWVFNPRMDSENIGFGDRFQGDLAGIALPDADLMEDDEIEYSGDTYVVDAPPVTWGDTRLDDYVKFTLSRKQD